MRVEKARARIRRHVWNLLPCVPASKVAGTDLAEIVVLDVDATLVSAHSEKEQAAATFKGGFGFHPLGVWCDNTTELLAVTLRRATPAVTRRGTTSISTPSHRSGSGRSSARFTDPSRRGRCHPRVVGLAHRARPGPRPPTGVLDQLSDQE